MLSSKSAKSDTQKRKSCLKRSSFEMSEPRKIRRSKFEEIDANKIDGKLIVHKGVQRQSIENKPGDNPDPIAESSDSDN